MTKTKTQDVKGSKLKAQVKHAQDPDRTDKVVALVPAKQTPIAALTTITKQVDAGLEQMAALLSRPGLSPGALAEAYVLLDKRWKKIVNDQRDVVNEVLKNLSKTHPEIEYNGKRFTLEVTSRRSKTPSVKALLARAHEKGLSVDEPSLCDQVVSYELSMDKARAFFSEEELEACREQLSEALSVKVE